MTQGGVCLNLPIYLNKSNNIIQCCVYFRIALLTTEEWDILRNCYVYDEVVHLYFGELGTFKSSKPGKL